MFDQLNLNKPAGEPQPESVTTPQPPSNDQACMTKNPTIGSPNLTMSDEQPKTLSINTTDYLSEQSSQPTENIPDEQPRHQQQTILNQQTTTQENLNVEPSSNNPIASESSVTPRKVIERTENSKNKMPKKTPISRPSSGGARSRNLGGGHFRGNTHFGGQDRISRNLPSPSLPKFLTPGFFSIHFFRNFFPDISNFFPDL